MDIGVWARRGHSIRQIAKALGVSRDAVHRYFKTFPSRITRCESLSPSTRSTISYASGSGRCIRSGCRPPCWCAKSVSAATTAAFPSCMLGRLGSDRPGPSTARWCVSRTNPGKQMHADFVVFHSAKSSLSACVTRLGYSRMIYVHFVPDESF